MNMTSSRPYLIRAMYEWISDNGLTPYILVAADEPGVDVPRQYIDNGKIILNISARAVTNLYHDNEWLNFSARFNGQKTDVAIPVNAVMAIYAKENGKGMVLDQENRTPPPKTPPRKKIQRPHLQLVK